MRKKPRRPIVTADELRSPAAPAPAKVGGYAGRITSASMSKETAELARRLAIALAQVEGRIPSLGEVLGRALELLREQLEGEGVTLPPGGEVRPGPRGGGR